MFEQGYSVIHSHIDNGEDFFKCEPSQYDIIISNPPFSQKDNVLKRLYELNKPFAILLPLNSLQGTKRFAYFKQGIEILSFDKRVGFHDSKHMDKPIKGSPFASAYFCHGVLNEKLIVEELVEYDRPLINS